MPFDQVMHKFKAGALHSGGAKGPVVKSRKQAIAILLSEKKAAMSGKAEYQPAGGKMFGQPHQHHHMMAGIKAAHGSSKTPAHLKPHLKQRMEAVPMFGVKKKKAAPVKGVAKEEYDIPTDANDDEATELQPGMGKKMGPIQRASHRTPSFGPAPSVAAVHPKKQMQTRSVAAVHTKGGRHVKMVKGNKIPRGFFG